MTQKPGSPFPSSLRPGEVLLLADIETHSSVWLLRRRAGNRSAAGYCYEFGQAADDAWRAAVSLLPRSMPVLWRPSSGLDLNARQALRLGVKAKSDWHPAVDDQIDGRSFGLSFLLALGSEALDIPLPVNVVASAELEANGRLLPVASLESKLEAVAEIAPKVTLVLVAKDQPPISDTFCIRFPHLHVLRVNTAQDAILTVFGDAPAEWIRAHADAHSRDLFVASLLRSALEVDYTTTDWSPFNRAAEFALQEWDGLSFSERETLRFVAAVFLRRHGSGAPRDPLGTPRDTWLEEFPEPTRLAIIRKLVLQSAMTGDPVPAEIEAVARGRLARIGDSTNAHRSHLRLQAALGRLLAVTGRPNEGLELQEKVVAAFFARFRYEDASEALTECFQLAAGLEDVSAFGRAEQSYLTMQAFGGPDPRELPRLEVSRILARQRLGHVPNDIDIERLHSIAFDTALHPTVVYAALRGYLRLLFVADRRTEAEAAITRLETEDPRFRHDVAIAGICCALVKLDRALAEGNSSTAKAALIELGNDGGALITHLTAAACLSGVDAAAFVARWFPL
jgi:hypothetical protein